VVGRARALHEFLEDGEKSVTFKRVLMHRIKSSHLRFVEDFDLMIKVISKLEAE